MSELLQAFVGNPLSTFIGKKIEAATRPELETDDWALNLEICDIINENDNDAKDAVRAIKKRLQQIEQDRNFVITNRTLTVLDTCVSNCSHRFHVLVMTKDFIQDLVKLIGPKNNPPIDLQERVLRSIERWADAFKNQPDLAGVVSVYNELKAKGVTFPERDPNCPNVPIQTPQRSVPRQPSPVPRSNIGQSGTIPAPAPSREQPVGPVTLEGEGYNKISRDLGVVQTSIEMFGEILGLLEEKSSESDWKLANDLNSTCRQMKERIVDLIERVANEDLTIELLRLNDELNNVFVKYDRQVKNRTKLPTSTPSSQAETRFAPPPMKPTPSQTVSQPQNDLSLIDFNIAEEPNPPTKQEQPSTSVTRAAEVVPDPFDTSATIQALTPTKSGKVTQSELLEKQLGQLDLGQAKNSPSTAGDKVALPKEISSVREQDFAEIENWLATDSGRNLASLGGDTSSTEPMSLSNSDFDKFIASRAMAGSAQPKASNPSSETKPKPEPSA